MAGADGVTAIAVVAIDGPAGSGKSTVARAVAEALGLPTLETGAMYRALTWTVLRDGVDPADAAGVTAVAGRARIEVDGRVLVDGEDVTAAIRSPEVTAAVSAVSAVPGAREALVRRQQAWIADHGSAVVEGRDIGTVVAPDAVLKVFLIASEEERARRRHAEDRPAQGVTATLEDIRRRDLHDSSRPVAPLAAAPDAVVLDTTGRSIGDVVAEIVARFREALAAT